MLPEGFLDGERAGVPRFHFSTRFTYTSIGMALE